MERRQCPCIYCIHMMYYTCTCTCDVTYPCSLSRTLISYPCMYMPMYIASPPPTPVSCSPQQGWEELAECHSVVVLFLRDCYSQCYNGTSDSILTHCHLLCMLTRSAAHSTTCTLHVHCVHVQYKFTVYMCDTMYTQSIICTCTCTYTIYIVHGW